MNLLSQIKTAAKKSAAKSSVPVIAPPTPATSKSEPTNPADDICNLEDLAGMLQRLQTRNQQYQRAIDALVAARRVVNGWDPKPEPELIWSVRREVLVAMNDQDALARFDRDHAQDLATEQAARHTATQQALEAPARVKALEQYIKDLAAEMAGDVDESFIHKEMTRLFEPSAQRMLTAAQAFVQAWREMRTAESSLKSAFQLTHYSVQGDRRSGYEMSLIGKANDGDLLPTLIEGVAYDDLVDLNRQFRRGDHALSRQINQQLTEAGIPAGRLRVYHPGAVNDDRPIYAPDPNPPRKRPPESPFGGATVVTIQT